jgi:glycosyltransferase involved in cell wall biosynthesis
MTPRSPLVSIVLCTWNRSALLTGALGALTRQQDPPPHEIIVVNNGSTDNTADVVARFARRAPHVRGVFERTPGLSHARNAGIDASRAPIVAFTDDDVRVGTRWVVALADAFARYQDAACVGGPVTPVWPGRVPPWMTERHWAPLGIQHHGDQPFRVDQHRPVCLIGANLAFRRTAIDALGGFDPRLQRVREGGGTTEDHDWHVRLWRAGLHGVYEPALAVSAVVDPARLRKQYHRRWHYGHGRHIARMRLPEFESTRSCVFGVPGHLLRQAAGDAWGVIAGATKRDVDAFTCEARLWFAAGFVRERWA